MTPGNAYGFMVEIEKLVPPGLSIDSKRDCQQVLGCRENSANLHKRY